MAKRAKRQKTICGAEAPSGEIGIVYVCTLPKGHTGNHQQGNDGSGKEPSWPQESSAPPATKPDSEQVQDKAVILECIEGIEVVGESNSPNGRVVNIGLASDKLLVDKLLFSRAVKAIIQGAQGGRAYANRAGITRFGQMLGGKNQQEYEELYRACMEAVAEDNKLQKAR